MNPAGVARRGQRRAESLMVDTVTITRPGGTTTDPDTGETVTTTTQVYSGPGKLQTTDQYEHTSEVGGAVMTVQRFLVHIPAGAAACRVGDNVQIASTVDPLLNSRPFRIAGIAPVKTFATAYRMFVEEV